MKLYTSYFRKFNGMLWDVKYTIGVNLEVV